MEKPFHIKLNGGEEFELNRYNSALVRYLGNLALHDHVQLATEYGISSIPCLVVLKNGQESARSVGFLPKQALQDMLDKYI